MTLASAARHVGKKCYILLLPEEGLDGEALFGETQHPSTLWGYSEVFGIGDSGSGFAPLSEKALSCPWRGVGSYFPASGHFRPPAPLLTAEHGARRCQAELQANELVGLIPAWR